MHKCKVPLVVPATQQGGRTKTLAVQTLEGTTEEDLTKDRPLELLWLLSEGEHRRRESSNPRPAETVQSNRSTEDFVPTAQLNTLREPKKGTSGVPADQLYNSSAVGSVPVPVAAGTMGFVAQQRWHQTKPEGLELNRAHMSQYIHHEATAEGMEVDGREEPQYQTTVTPIKTTVDPERKKSVATLPRDENVRPGENMVREDEPTLFGPSNLRERLKQLCTEYRDIISIKLNTEPANLPPLELKVEDAKWRVSSNQGPARHQTDQKNKEVLKQINKLLPIGVLAPSQAEHYSQVHLTPKPNNEWRFCLDFRWLNLVSTGMGWPLPNIPHMLQRLGAKRAKYYAKIDLTAGYHQAPLAKDSRVYTAFTCFMGIYEWCRVPMGLKGAPAYFQGVLASIVLLGLLYFICELYIDDIIVHGRDEEEFLANLEAVFKRLRKFRLTCNPKKMFLGMEEVEFVGHTLNVEGISFSREKIEKVMAIKEPTYGKELKTFLGVAGYFHSHIKDYARVVRPLHKMIASYERNRKLIWTNEGRVAFHLIKKAINDCPTLFFVNDDSPIFLHTDACDYGLGGYVFQIIEDKEVPVAFTSKILTEQEQRWTTTEKEAYAIVYCMKKFEYLLRDRTFILRTDHKNLTYVDTETSAKVKRWKLTVQEYDFFIEHIAGKKNIVADGFSRLLSLREEHIYLLEEFTLSNEVYETIRSAHNEIVGHHGVERTFNKLTRMGKHWKYMREQVKRFIKQCPCCQKMSYLRTPIHTHPYTTACYEPMERWEIDTIGPLPEDEDGNRFILVIICCFTRWANLYAIKDTTARSCVDAVMQHVGTFGTPNQILTDNGTQFINELVEELLKIIGVQHLTILAYSKEENAIVERVNKEVMRHLRNLIFAHNEIDKWSKHYLPLVQRILNTSRVDSHNAVPAELLFGNAITLDRGVLLPATAISDNRKALSTWAADMLAKQEDLMKTAKEIQRLKDDKHIAMADPRRTTYNIDEYVLVEYQPSSLVKGRPPNKLLPNLRGPMRVRSRNGDKYKLTSLIDKEDEEIHISKIIHPQGKQQCVMY